VRFPGRVDAKVADTCSRPGFHVGGMAYYRRIAFWKTPVADCGDSRGAVCVDYATWAQACPQIKG
jgi:putative spermidine/putrescine transport system substrate-binding protein